ncbi:MAG: hypothetical protein N2A99_06525 [Carnobacterium alterfunditum]
MPEIIEVVKSTTKSFRLKALNCKDCGGFYTIYDSREENKYNQMSESQKQNHQTEVKKIEDMENQSCNCGEGILKIEDNTYSEFINGYTIIKCSCGEKLNCENFTNTCKCGKDYNFNGDELTDRREWGYETGENWGDCY